MLQRKENLKAFPESVWTLVNSFQLEANTLGRVKFTGVTLSDIRKGGEKLTESSYSQSASANTMHGLFPPSSRVTLFRLLFPAASLINLPTWNQMSQKRRFSLFSWRQVHMFNIMTFVPSPKFHLEDTVIDIIQDLAPSDLRGSPISSANMRSIRKCSGQESRHFKWDSWPLCGGRQGLVLIFIRTSSLYWSGTRTRSHLTWFLIPLPTFRELSLLTTLVFPPPPESQLSSFSIPFPVSLSIPFP